MQDRSKRFDLLELTWGTLAMDLLKKIGRLVSGIAGTMLGAGIIHAEPGAASPSFFDLRAKSISGSDVEMASYRGKVVMVVNTASKCGFTSQYKGLEEIFERFKDRGFVILGFPSNDFLAQEPGNDQEIKKFCELNFGVTFPLFSKGGVSGDTKQPVFKYLTEQVSEPLRGEVQWNFEKFLVNRQGQVVSRLRSAVKPTDPKVIEIITKLLEQSL